MYLNNPLAASFILIFIPELTPQQMLELGVFGGKYMIDCRDEFPASWFKMVLLSHERHDPQLNFFGINASQHLPVWRKKAAYIMKIHEASFSGTVAITGDVAAPMMKDR